MSQELDRVQGKLERSQAQIKQLESENQTLKSQQMAPDTEVCSDISDSNLL